MRIFLNIVTCLVILIFPFTATFSQIVGLNADKDTITAYSNSDHIFVFNQFPTAKKGGLQIYSPDNANATFIWSKFNTTTFKFDIPVATTPNSIISKIYSIDNGGYQVIVNSSVGAPSDTFIAWVFLNSYKISINKDTSGNMVNSFKHCTYMDLLVTPEIINFTYYNPSDTSHHKITMENKLKYTWTFKPNLMVPPKIDTGFLLSVGNGNGKPPADTTKINVNVTDRFNLTIKDSMIYNAPFYSTLANFHMSCKLYPDSIIAYSKANTDTFSAPLAVIFTDSSVNAKSHFWKFGDIPYNSPSDTSYKKNPTHTYYIPKKDTIRLVVTSSWGCKDDTTEQVWINKPFIGNTNVPPRPLSQSEIKLTNAFVAGKENFKLVVVSVNILHITIYSKWGDKVYEYNQPAIDWQGWDGTTPIGGKAPQGVYYYVIQASTWDPFIDTFFNSDGIYKGFLYLFREN